MESVTATMGSPSTTGLSLVTVPTLGETYGSSDLSAGSGLSIQSDFPARTVEAGETVVFVLNIKNGDADQDPRRIWASPGGGTSGWEYAFRDDSSEVSMIDIPAGSQKSVRLEIDTAAETGPGRYPVSVHVGEVSYTVYVTISRSHAGDRGTLKLVVYDKDGSKVKGAQINLMAEGGDNVMDRILSASDGTVNADVSPGTYDLRIHRDGYEDTERNQIRIRGGVTTDLGTITLDPKTFAAEIVLKTSTAVSTVGKNAQFDLQLKNIGRSDDTYRLGAEGVPENWYVRYRDRDDKNVEIQEISLPAGETRQLSIEAIPNLNVPAGTYNLTATIESAGETYTRNLAIKLQGSYMMKVSSGKYQYDLNRGDPLEFNFTVANEGNAGALTNLNVTLIAPEGWSGVVSPSMVGSIPAGSNSTFSVNIIPPSSIAASEYRIGVRVVADQAQEANEYRVITHEQSYTFIFGLMLLAGVGGGVWILFRKYRRR
ncbi:MAG: NEW3 domain-containing protein [Methanospirillum sp.]